MPIHYVTVHASLMKRRIWLPGPMNHEAAETTASDPDKIKTPDIYIYIYTNI